MPSLRRLAGCVQELTTATDNCKRMDSRLASFEARDEVGVALSRCCRLRTMLR